MLMIDPEKIPDSQLRELLIKRQNLDEMNRLFDENKQDSFSGDVIQCLTTALSGHYDYQKTAIQNFVSASVAFRRELECLDLAQQRAVILAELPHLLVA
jgi:hypothetical protein